MTGALSEEGNLDTVQTDREGGHVKTEADIGVIHLQTKEHQGLSVTTRMQKKEGFFPTSFEGISDFWPPELRSNILIVLSHQVHSTLLWQPQETHECTVLCKVRAHQRETFLLTDDKLLSYTLFYFVISVLCSFLIFSFQKKQLRTKEFKYFGTDHKINKQVIFISYLAKNTQFFKHHLTFCFKFHPKC